MFAREQRLVNEKLFASLFRRGNWVRGRSFSLILMPHRTGQIGFVLTKKAVKSAAARNRTKRRIRALFQEYLKGEFAPLLEKNLLAVMIHKSVDDLSPEALRTEVTHLLDKWSQGKIQPPKERK